MDSACIGGRSVGESGDVTSGGGVHVQGCYLLQSYSATESSSRGLSQEP